jgi:hypothetical protein
MKRAVLLPLILTIVLACPSIGFTSDKPVKATTPLSEDEAAIYKAVLRHYSKGENAALNVAQNTYPLDPSSPMSGLQGETCLKDIRLDNLSTTAHSFHELKPDVLPGKKMQLVDPEKQGKIVRSNDPSTTIRKGKKVDNAVESAFATALFSMSEIAFDKEHRFAVVSYRFWCGSLCGHGSTLVFEKVNGVWRNANRNCGGWIS